MSEALIAGGVPGDRIVRELCSLSTRENAWYSAPLLRMLGAQRVGIVTCDWHMARACATFRAQGVLPEPLPAPRPSPCAGGRLLRAVREAVSAKIGMDPLDPEDPWLPA